MRIPSAGQTSFLIASLVTLTACSDSSNTTVNSALDADAPALTTALETQTDSDPVINDVTVSPSTQQPPVTDVTQINTPAADAPDTSVVQTPAVNESTNEDAVIGEEAPASSSDDNAADAPPVDNVVNTPTDEAPAAPATPPANQTPVQGEIPALVASNSAAGIDSSGGNDDSPTRTETLSLVGPFLKDVSRPAGPPSVPTGLVALMASDDWVEFSWVPSVDDQSVEGYEVQRNGEVVHTIRFDNPYEFDHRSWIGTNYMDCNYTRYTFCESNAPASGSTNSYSIVAIDNEGMRSAPSAPVTITLPQRQTGAADLTGYSLVLDEEFDGEGLDRALWKTSLPWGPDRIINAEQQYFVNLFANDDVNYDPFVFNGSTLSITAIPTPASELSGANNQPYLSGVISTQDNFSFTYGYVEMNAKVASGQGFLSTFYLFNQSFEDNKPELDILEYRGDLPTTSHQTYHYFDSNRTRWASGETHSSPTMTTDVGFDLSSGFHKYAMLWEPGLAVWYIDDVEVRRIEGPRVSSEPMNVIAHLVVGSEWIGAPASAAQFPNSMEIDYIKVWQR